MPPRPKAVSGVSWEEKQQQLATIQKVLNDMGTVVAFTDGSALGNPGPGGAAALIVVMPTLEDKKHLELNQQPQVESKTYVAPAKVTNNQMELKGLDLALDLLDAQQQRKTQGRTQKWVVFTDSDYVCGLFERGHSAHKNQEIVSALRKRLSSLSQQWGLAIQVQWVRSHCGIEYNEQVDKLSREAAKQCRANLAKSPHHPPPPRSSASNKAPLPIRLNHVRKQPALLQRMSGVKRSMPQHTPQTMISKKPRTL